MVGGLADWFAVTALFRHPLGIPIPHTAIIAARKEQLGRALGNFVQRHFLSRDVLAAKLAQAKVGEHLANWLAERPVRRDVAMTGEVTLRGKVLEVGGVKEKVMAAYRAGLREAILPKTNEKDLREIPDEVREGMTFTFASTMDEVFRLALLPPAAPRLADAPPKAPASKRPTPPERAVPIEKRS